MDVLLVVLEAIFCIAVAAHLASIAIVLSRCYSREQHISSGERPGVTVLRPVCGLENNLEETLGSTFSLTYSRYEVIFCIAAVDDLAIALVERLIAANPGVDAKLLIGNDDMSANPKLNNLAKGWRSARYEWIAMADSNLLLPHDYIEGLLSCWTANTGLVSSPAVGVRPEGFWAELECAFLNTHEARWQIAADALGFGFTQGKTMFWRRDILEAAGGLAALASEAAEDAAATKVVHKAGLKVRLPRMPFSQPLGPRSLPEVWRRQLRWARLRRATFPAVFLPELLAGGLFPLCAAALIAAQKGVSVGWVLALFLVWYGCEAALARVAGWPSSPQSILACILRDLFLPVLWLCAWMGSDFVWRGHPMVAAKMPAGPPP
jgi:ceramide glucosyltransferase